MRQDETEIRMFFAPTHPAATPARSDATRLAGNGPTALARLIHATAVSLSTERRPR